jgi:hypothetical protein
MYVISSPVGDGSAGFPTMSHTWSTSVSLNTCRIPGPIGAALTHRQSRRDDVSR